MHASICVAPNNSEERLAVLQESKEVLERLRRMDNFESQDFDTVVRWPLGLAQPI